jgi:peptide deformylase
VAILKVARLGHPVIREPARPLTEAEIASPDVQRLIDDMVDTMHEYEGVGLAAPQVHLGLRLAVIEIDADDERGEERVELTVLVNPRFTPAGRTRQAGAEGCLSIPGLRGEVPRFTRGRLEARDRFGRPFTRDARGFLARVVQHECDHLDGRVYLDRMEGLRSLGFVEELERHAWTEAAEA